MVVAACGPSSSGSGSSSGNVPSGPALAAVTPAGTRKQAGDPGKTITFGTSSQLAVVAGVTAAYLFSPWADQLGGTG